MFDFLKSTLTKKIDYMNALSFLSLFKHFMKRRKKAHCFYIWKKRKEKNNNNKFSVWRWTNFWIIFQNSHSKLNFFKKFSRQQRQPIEKLVYIKEKGSWHMFTLNSLKSVLKNFVISYVITVLKLNIWNFIFLGNILSILVIK